MVLVVIFKSGKVSKVTIYNLDVVEKIKRFFSGSKDDRFLIIEDQSKTFMVDLESVSAIEIDTINKKKKM